MLRFGIILLAFVLVLSWSEQARGDPEPDGTVYSFVIGQDNTDLADLSISTVIVLNYEYCLPEELSTVFYHSNYTATGLDHLSEKGDAINQSTEFISKEWRAFDIIYYNCIVLHPSYNSKSSYNYHYYGDIARRYLT